eukprot:scpid6005/ scgid11882/ Lathosterol oxidase; C-5 sterol desaturase; Delta(7)-sterol 5-desaturase; Lathosterol 5-desaturase; Sterol-C5-desaturase
MLHRCPAARTATWLRTADAIAWLLPAAMTAVCVLTESPWVFLSSLCGTFVAISVPTMVLSAALHWFCCWHGKRIQGERKRPAPIGREVLETLRCLYTVSCIAAWPVSRYRLGHATGITWEMHDLTTSWMGVIGHFVFGLAFADFWNYWKHRILHTRVLFAFHKNHHQFRDPTAFAGFAIHPVDAVLTFAPIWFMCVPTAKHWMPLYFTQVVFLSLVNLYLHCGVTFDWMERLIPLMLLNSSGYHNVHHEKVTANYGEVSFVWDYICGTDNEAQVRQRQQARAKLN